MSADPRALPPFPRRHRTAPPLDGLRMTAVFIHPSLPTGRVRRTVVPLRLCQQLACQHGERSIEDDGQVVEDAYPPRLDLTVVFADRKVQPAPLPTMRPGAVEQVKCQAEEQKSRQA